MSQKCCPVRLALVLVAMGALMSALPASASPAKSVIKGKVWFDEDYDGSFDKAGDSDDDNVVEDPIEGITVKFFDTDNHTHSTTTDGDGNYSQEVGAGHWTVQVFPPVDFYPQVRMYTIDVLSGHGEEHKANFPLIYAKGWIKGRIFIDSNDNDQYDSGETMVPGGELRCSNQGNGVDVTIDAEGTFSHQGRVGTWTCVYTPPAGYRTNSATVSVDIDSHDETVFIMYTVEPADPAAPAQPPAAPAQPAGVPISASAGGLVRGLVFVDSDGDGEPGPEEEKLGGVSLTFKSGDDSRSATSADDGSYSVEVGVGNWLVDADPPEGYQMASAPQEVGVGGAGAVVPDVNVALVEGTAAGGKALPASGSAIAPALVVAGFGLLFGVGFGLWLAGRRRSAQAD
jgi:hypothetical protein